MKRPIELVKNRSDIGAGTRGSDLGIDAMEIAAINQGDQFFYQYPFVDVPTRNYAVYENDTKPFGKRIKQVFAQCRRVADAVEDLLNRGNFPLVFSGDHSSAIGTISGIKSAFADKTLGVIWIDAHADLHSPYTTPSGNLHGMPLAAVTGEDNLDARINEVDSETLQYWEELKGLGSKSPKVLPHHLVYFGVRDTEEQEDSLIDRMGIKNYQVSEIRRRGILKCMKETLGLLAACDLIYVSFDVDSMDSELISDGTGTPVPKGFAPEEVTGILHHIIPSGKLICLEVVEVNPLLDHKGNKMAEVAFEIVSRVTRRLSVSQSK